MAHIVDKTIIISLIVALITIFLFRSTLDDSVLDPFRFLASLKITGERGPEGRQGPRGFNGTDGKQGPQGKQGPKGDPLNVSDITFDLDIDVNGSLSINGTDILTLINNSVTQQVNNLDTVCECADEVYGILSDYFGDFQNITIEIRHYYTICYYNIRK